MPGTASLPLSTLVVLLGASAWPKWPSLGTSETFANAANGLATYFVETFGLPQDNLCNLFDSEKDPNGQDLEIADFLTARQAALKDSASPATDVVVYYVGHGGFEGGDADFYLAIRSSREENKSVSSIGFQSLAKTIGEKARHLRCYFILDCCFAAASKQAFQSPLQDVVEERTQAAIKLYPTRGTSLLCSSASDKPSQATPDESFTMFSGALLRALQDGDTKRPDLLTLRQLRDLIWDIIEDKYGDKGVRPEVHSPVQGTGDIAELPFFPNRTHAAVKAIELFTPAADGVIQCCVVVSATELALGGESLKSIVTRSLIKYQTIIQQEAHQALQLQPYVINAEQVVSSAMAYENAIVALCQTEIAVFDLTHYEPAVMLLLGIRAVARRGITISSIGGDYAIGDPLDYPFNIKEVNIISHSPKQLYIEDPIDLIGNKIIEGFKQLQHVPHYLDLPAFDAIRSLPPDMESRSPQEYNKQVLVLCPFSNSYATTNWKRHLSRNLGVYLPRDKSGEPKILRTLDMKSPRLVSQSLYEAIRLTSMCIVDWTEWRPNVFFEFGVRLASSSIGPVCIIEKRHKDLIDKLHQEPDEARRQMRRFGIPEDEFARLAQVVPQCKYVLKLFNHIEYRAPTEEERSEPDLQAFQHMVSYHEKLIRAALVKETWDGLAPDFTYRTVSKWVDWRMEVSSTPVYDDLINAANLLSNPNIDSEGRSPVLYPGNIRVKEEATKGALERRLAAWYYLNKRHGQALPHNRALRKACIALGDLLAPELRRSPQAEDIRIARQIRRRVKKLLAFSEDIFEEVQYLKNSAKANRDFNDYDAALDDLEQAIQRLSGELRAAEGRDAVRDAYLQNRRYVLAHELADCFGMEGGIYRRKGELDEAIKKYEEGYDKYEGNAAYDIQDSYNLINAIVVRILHNPHDLENLRLRITTAVETLQKQVEGKRRNQWWAWADLGLLLLLSDDIEAALRAYEQFKDKGALAQHYGSTIAVLAELQSKLASVGSPAVSSIERAIQYLQPDADEFILQPGS